MTARKLIQKIKCIFGWHDWKVVTAQSLGQTLDGLWGIAVRCKSCGYYTQFTTMQKKVFEHWNHREGV